MEPQPLEAAEPAPSNLPEEDLTYRDDSPTYGDPDDVDNDPDPDEVDDDDIDNDPDPDEVDDDDIDNDPDEEEQQTKAEAELPFEERLKLKAKAQLESALEESEANAEANRKFLEKPQKRLLEEA